MLNVLVPVPVSNAGLAVEAIEAIAKHTDIPFSLVVILDGGMRDDYIELEAFLSGYAGKWKLLNNLTPVYLNQSIREGLEECDQKLTAIIQPQVRIDDPQWFGKAQVIFSRDPICGIVDTWPNTKSTTMHPVRRQHNRPADDGSFFAIVQTAFARKTVPFGVVDPFQFWSRSVMGNGGSSWAAPSIRYHVVEHKMHMTYRAPAATSRG